MTTSLFVKIRECSVCHCTAPHNVRNVDPKATTIVAISTLIYRRANGKRILRPAIRVQICDQCLSKALTSHRLGFLSGNHEANSLWENIRETLYDCYSGLLDDME